MGRIAHRSVGLTLVVALGMAGCAGDDDEAVTTPTTASVETVNGCRIEPKTACPGADLSGRDLQGALLAGADLSDANLAGAELDRANLSNADLRGTELTEADLRGVTMLNTDLGGADLTKADFTGGNLENVNLATAVHCGTIRTDGSIDNAGCPPPMPPTTTSPRTTSTTIRTDPPPCDSLTFLRILRSQGGDYGATAASGAPTCSGLFAVQRFSDPTTIGLFGVGADVDAWRLISVGNFGEQAYQGDCPALPPPVAVTVGCGRV